MGGVKLKRERATRVERDKTVATRSNRSQSSSELQTVNYYIYVLPTTYYLIRFYYSVESEVDFDLDNPKKKTFDWIVSLFG